MSRPSVLEDDLRARHFACRPLLLASVWDASSGEFRQDRDRPTSVEETKRWEEKRWEELRQLLVTVCRRRPICHVVAGNRQGHPVAD